MAGQVKKEYTAREPELVRYLAIVRALEQRLGFTLKHIPRLENSEADELAKAAANNHTLARRNVLPRTRNTSNRGNSKSIQTNASHQV
jgi:hypothetical protein